LRERDVERAGFLNKNYDPLEVYAQATFLNRTLESAICQLQGFYPEKSFNFDSSQRLSEWSLT
jgi:hypothetical protein